MCNVNQLHELIKDKLPVVEESYLSFYRKVLSGDIKHYINGSCMTR